MISILHRAKDAKSKNWIFGTPKYSGNSVLITSESTQQTYLVDKSTVCKYTELKDRDSCRIFEGDVIQVTQRGPKLAVVEWDNENLGWKLNCKIPANKPKSLLKYKPCIQASKAHLYKVVGNIYDSPEYYAFQLD